MVFACKFQVDFLAFFNPSLSEYSKIYIKPNFSRFFLQFHFLEVSFPANLWLLFFILVSFGKLHIRAEFSISFCAEDGILIATKTAISELPTSRSIYNQEFFKEYFGICYLRFFKESYYKQNFWRTMLRKKEKSWQLCKMQFFFFFLLHALFCYAIA